MFLLAASCSSDPDVDKESRKEDPASIQADTPDPSSSVASGDPIQPCDVMTAESAGLAIGIPLQEGERLVDGNRRGCDYFAEGSTPVAAVFYEPGVDLEDFLQRIAAGRRSGSLLRPSDSIADASFWAEDRRATLARIGESMIQIFLVGPDFVDPVLGEAAGGALLNTFVELLEPSRTHSEPSNEADDDVSDPSEAAPPLTFADNVFAGVQSGAWDLGEGISRTLRAVFGDPDAAGSIALSVVDDELTELIAMANDYLESGEDRQARSEIAEVLDRI